ncbi:MAG: SoxR reducing system RseC family protein [Proteobacteria bacterium]|nr:SoxR reducing system RseC family protein [Pseudomonadota bacterium]
MRTICNDQGQIAETFADGTALVVVSRGDACDQCAARGACGAFGGRHQRVELRLPNRVGAKQGDTVRVTMSEAALIGISAMFYLVPALFLLAGALLGHLLWTGTTHPDLTVAVGAGIGLLLGFLVARRLSHRAEKKKRLIPTLESVVTFADSNITKPIP